MTRKFSSGAAFAGLGALLLLGAVAGCRGGLTVAAPGLAVGPLATVGAPQGRHYRIDPARSEVRILAYRAGTLAHLGHNHVLVVHGLRGDVWLSPPPAPTTFRLAFPVAELEIDAAAARQEEGAEFVSVPTAADIEGTRRNLFGPKVLDATTFPEIKIAGQGVFGGSSTTARVQFELRDRTSEIEVPLVVELVGGDLTVRGGFTVLQTALGLTPFSVALGALQVRDDLSVRLVLRAAGAPADIP